MSLAVTTIPIIWLSFSFRKTDIQKEDITGFGFHGNLIVYRPVGSQDSVNNLAFV